MRNSGRILMVLCSLGALALAVLFVLKVIFHTF